MPLGSPGSKRGGAGRPVMNLEAMAMRRCLVFLAAILLVSAMLVPVAGAYAAGPAERYSQCTKAIPLGNSRPDRMKNQVIVSFKPGAGEASKNNARRAAGALAVVRDDAGAQLLQLGPDVSVEGAVASLSSNPDVLYAEPNYIARATYRPKDPDYPRQWGLNNTGQVIKGQEGTPGADINAEGAWNVETGGTTPVTVAVIDTGGDLDHPDLSSKFVPGYNFAGISQLMDYYYDGGYYQRIAHLGSTAWPRIAQSVTGTGQNLTAAGFEFYKTGSPTTITVALRSSLSGTNLASYTVNPAEIASSGVTYIYKNFSTPVKLAKGVKYYIVLYQQTPSASDHYWIVFNPAGDYPGNVDEYREGDMYAQNSSSTWVDYAPYDLFFKTNANASAHDDQGHGTHCAGIAAAVQGNNKGGVGVSFGARVMPVKVLASDGSGTYDDIYSGVRWAADHGAQVLSMSLGGPGSSAAGQAAVNHAHNTRGAVVFASAGNSGDSTKNYPAGYDNVIGVGATDNRDKYTAFSTYNSDVDLSAPGWKIYSTLPMYPCSLNSWGYQQKYDYLSGTSMACPMASGLGALVRSKYPAWTPAQVQSRMQKSAKDLGAKGRDDHYGWGRIDALRTLGGGDTWYLAEGTTAWGFSTQVSIQNPNPATVHAQITYNTSEGDVPGGTVTLPALSQATVNPAEKLGSKDFSTKVVCTEGNSIAVDRTMTWNSGAGEEGHSSIGVTSPAKTWYLPEGSTNWNFETWLLIQNPQGKDASCKVTYMIEGRGPETIEHKVPARSRASFSMAQDIGQADASIKVESDQEVIPERAMYRNDRREGHDSIGTTTPASTYYLAEGATGYDSGYITYVLVQNPHNSANGVNITYQTPSGEVPGPSFTMEPNSRRTVRVNDQLPPNTDVSTVVHGTKPIIAERAMYWNSPAGEACHDSIGLAAPHTAFYLPDGQTSGGRETWTLVQNPGKADVQVEISYMTPTGKGNVVFSDTIPGNSRKSYNMADRLSDSRASVMVRSKDPSKKIMVERAMYWGNRGAGTDTIGGFSD